MNANDINELLNRPFIRSARILRRQLRVAKDLQKPSDSSYETGVLDSVSQQYHQVSASWNDEQLELRKNENGRGYFVPYISQVRDPPKGSKVTKKNRALGTYTRSVPADKRIEWVVTGPFSGCYAASFFLGNGEMVFAHIVAMKGPKTHEKIEWDGDLIPNCDLPVNQVRRIKRQLEEGGLNPVSKIVWPKALPHGAAGQHAYVFWTYHDGSWFSRTVSVDKTLTTVVDVRPRQRLDKFQDIIRTG